MHLPFLSAYMFRPGFIRPTQGLKNTHAFYRVLTPLFPPANLLFSGAVLTLKEVGLAMINSVASGPAKRVLGVRDIAEPARKT